MEVDEEDEKQLGQELRSNSLTTRLEISSRSTCVGAGLGAAMGTRLGEALQVNTSLKELVIESLIAKE